MFCSGPLLASLHWIVRKSHGVPPLGLDAFCQTRRCWKDFPFANCRPLLLVLDNRSTVESPRKFAHCHVGMGIFSGKILPSPGMLALQKTIRKTTPLGGEGDFFARNGVFEQNRSQEGEFQSKTAEGGKKIEVFSRFSVIWIGWGQGFGCLNLLLLAWCGLGASIFLVFVSCLVFLFFVFSGGKTWL